MNKFIKIGTFAFAGALLFASCKKDWTCECTASAEGVNSSVSTTIKDTKKKAKDACEEKKFENGSCKIKE